MLTAQDIAEIRKIVVLTQLMTQSDLKDELARVGDEATRVSSSILENAERQKQDFDKHIEAERATLAKAKADIKKQHDDLKKKVDDLAARERSFAEDRAKKTEQLSNDMAEFRKKVIAGNEEIDSVKTELAHLRASLEKRMAEANELYNDSAEVKQEFQAKLAKIHEVAGA